MIIFLDTDNNKIVAYTEKGINTLDFSEVENLKDIDDNNIQYVTNIIDVSIQDIINTVKSVAPDLEYTKTKISPKKAIITEETSYLHSKMKGNISIPNLKNIKTGNDMNLTFKGGLDGYSISLLKSTFGNDFFEKYPIINKLMNEEKLEIIDGKTLDKVRKEESFKLKKRDDQDSILVPLGVKAADAAKNISWIGSDANEIDAEAEDTKDPLDNTTLDSLVNKLKRK